MERVPGTREVRAATLNLGGQHGAWDQRRAVLADGPRELRPDVVAFQGAVVGATASTWTPTRWPVSGQPTSETPLPRTQ
jgi:hypothetical protein